MQVEPQITNLDKLALISHEIEEIAETYKTDFIEATLMYCEKNKVEPEAIAEYIKKNENIKLKIEQSAEELHYMKKKIRLEI